MSKSDTYRHTIRDLAVGEFVTLEGRLPLGGSLQARRLANGTVQLYWRYTHEGATAREPIGLYDEKSPPKKLEPTGRGFGVAAALRHCEALARALAEWADRGGLKGKAAAEKAAAEAAKTAETEKAARTLAALLKAYTVHLKVQERRSWRDAQSIFDSHIVGAWPDKAKKPAADITPDDILDMQRRLIEDGKGRTANKLRAYVRAAFQCAVDVRTDAAIPVAFKAFAIAYNPAAATKRVPKFDRADKHPLTADELRAYWRKLKDVQGPTGAALRVHILTGGQRVEQFVRLQWSNVTDDTITIHDSKGRPGQGPRPHTLPLLRDAAEDLASLKPAPVLGERDAVQKDRGPFVFTTTDGHKPISAVTLAGWARDAAGADVTDFLIKRVRSGVETLLAANGIGREIRGHLQSHGLTGVQHKHYDAHDYLPEKRRALEVLLGELERKPNAKVTPIRPGKAA